MGYILPLLSFTTFVVYLNIGMYGFAIDRRSTLNRVFLYLSISSALYALGYTFFLAAPDYDTAIFWYKLSSFGMRSFPAFGFYFYLVLTNQEWVKRNPWIYVIFLPPLLVILRTFIGQPFYLNIVHTPLGWANLSYPHSPWYTVYNLYMLGFFLISMILVFRWSRKTTLLREKKQASIIIITSILTFVVSFIVNLVLTAFIGTVVPKVMAITPLIGAIGMWYAIVKYKFLAFTPSNVSEEIISRMTNILILADSQGSIVRFNSFAEELSGLSEREILGQPIQTVFLEEEQISEVMSSASNKFQISNNIDLSLKTKSGQPIPLNISVSMVKDRNQDLIGFVLMGQDQRPYLNAIKDCLTGVYARNYLMERFEEEKARHIRSHLPLSFAFIDLDYFKAINDTYGHTTGDEILREFTLILKSQLRNIDQIFRYGGDEFFVIFPGTHPDGVSKSIERVWDIVKAYAFYDKRSGEIIKLSFSCGITSLEDPEEVLDDILNKADHSLYAAKHAGRGRIISEVNKN